MAVNIDIERSQLDETEDLVRVQIASFHSDAVYYPDVEEGGPPGYDNVDVMRRRIVEDITFTIRVDGEIAGGIIVFPKDAAHMHLDVIFVEPTLHNKGVGSRAMSFLAEMYPGMTWTLDTPVYAVRNHHFYEKFGYLRGEAFEVDGFPLYPYTKPAETKP
jgi:GNAT superfamily N-acetyltransferase